LQFRRARYNFEGEKLLWQKKKRQSLKTIYAEANMEEMQKGTGKEKKTREKSDRVGRRRQELKNERENG